MRIRLRGGHADQVRAQQEVRWQICSELPPRALIHCSFAHRCYRFRATLRRRHGRHDAAVAEAESSSVKAFEACSRERCGRIPGQVASTEECSLQWIERALQNARRVSGAHVVSQQLQAPHLHHSQWRSGWSSHVLDEQQLAAGAQHAARLAQRGSHIPHRAEHHRLCLHEQIRCLRVSTTHACAHAPGTHPRRCQRRRPGRAAPQRCQPPG